MLYNLCSFLFCRTVLVVAASAAAPVTEKERQMVVVAAAAASVVKRERNDRESVGFCFPISRTILKPKKKT